MLANFYAGFGKHLNDTMDAGLDLTIDPDDYAIHNWCDKITKEGADIEVPKWIIAGGYKDMPIYSGAKEFVYKLMDKNDVFTVTARVGDFRLDFSPDQIEIIKNDTKKWFQNQGIPAEKLFFEHNKVEFCLDNGISIMIEDKPSTVVKAANNGIKSILVNRNWNNTSNSNELNHPNIYRANNYDDILNFIERIPE